MHKTKSPCIKQCQLDPQKQRCSTCKRTISEIVNWKTTSELEKQKIVQDLPNRN